MNEMLLPSGEPWKPDRSGFLKKSRNGMSLLRPVVLLAGGMVKTCELNEGWRNRLDECVIRWKYQRFKGCGLARASRISGASTRMEPCSVVKRRTLKDATCRALEVLWRRQVAPPSADFRQYLRSFGFMYGNSGECLGIVNLVSQVRQTQTKKSQCGRGGPAAPTLPFDHP